MYITSSSDTERNLAVELILEDIPGGGVVAKADFPTAQTTMFEGALLSKDSNGLYHPVKTVKVTATVASGTSAFVAPIGNNLKVGDILTNTAKTSTGRAISTIAASGTAYETITVGGAWGVALTANDVLIVGAATGASGTAYGATPIAIAMNNVDLAAKNTGCGLLVRGRVRESVLPQPVDAAIKALLPLIRFV